MTSAETSAQKNYEHWHMTVASRGCLFRRLWVIKVDFSGLACYWEHHNMSFWLPVSCSITSLDLLGLKGNIHEFLLFFWIRYDCRAIVIGCESGTEGTLYECCKNRRIWNSATESIPRSSYSNVGRNPAGTNSTVSVHKPHSNRIWIWNTESKCCPRRKLWPTTANVRSSSNYSTSWVCYTTELARDQTVHLLHQWDYFIIRMTRNSPSWCFFCIFRNLW